MPKSQRAQRSALQALRPALHAGGAALYGWKADAHIPPLDPEFFLLIGAELDRQQHTASARTATGNAHVREVVVAAVRAPILHEFFEPVIPARRGVGAAEERVGCLVVFGREQSVEILDPLLLAEIMEDEEKRSADDDQGSQRDGYGLNDLAAPLVAFAVMIQITGHSLLRLWLTFRASVRRRARDTSCCRRRWRRW